MTVTVKFPAELEAGLRRYAAATGLSTSVVIREAVAQYLVAAPAAMPSAHDLGAELFGRYSGPASLATDRKAELGAIWADKREKGLGAMPAAPSRQSAPGTKPPLPPARRRGG